MKVYDMSRKDFESLPCREWDKSMEKFDSLVILPIPISFISNIKYKIRKLLAKVFHLNEPEIWEINGMHDSGYQLIDFVACRGNTAICKLSGCSDVLHLDGIGGYGKDWLKKYGSVPDMIKPVGWCIDCLPNSGLLRLFTHDKLTVGIALSSFEVYSERRENENRIRGYN